MELINRDSLPCESIRFIKPLSKEDELVFVTACYELFFKYQARKAEILKMEVEIKDAETSIEKFVSIFDCDGVEIIGEFRYLDDYEENMRKYYDEHNVLVHSRELFPSKQKALKFAKEVKVMSETNFNHNTP